MGGGRVRSTGFFLFILADLAWRYLGPLSKLLLFFVGLAYCTADVWNPAVAAAAVAVVVVRGTVGGGGRKLARGSRERQPRQKAEAIV